MIVRRLHRHRLCTATWIVGSALDGTAALIQPEADEVEHYARVAEELGLDITEVVYNRAVDTTAWYADSQPSALFLDAIDPVAEHFGALLVRPVMGPQDSRGGLVTEVPVQVGRQVVRLKRFGSPGVDALSFPIAALPDNVVLLNLFYDVLTLRKGGEELRLMGSRLGDEARLIGVAAGQVFTGGSLPSLQEEPPAPLERGGRPHG
jgi:hypothetical protein